jgi:hypothetical protein
MFKTKTKVTRGGKSSNEEYIVIADTPTIAEAILMKELEGTTVEKTTNVSELNVQNIFESGDGYFYEIKIEYENETGTKTIKETYIQESVDLNCALEAFYHRVDFGAVKSIKELPFLGILK